MSNFEQGMSNDEGKKKRLVMTKHFLLVSLALLAPSAALASEQILLSRQAGVAATLGTGNKIITHQGKKHVAWMDKRGEFVSVIKTLDLASGKWSPTYTIGASRDNHGRPALTLDSRGYLHTVYGIHQAVIPYRRSVRPNDASEWTDERTFGGSLSYPTLLCGPDDRLFLSGRYGWDGVRFFVKPLDKNWEDRGLIIRVCDGCKSYAAFHEGLVWGPDHRTLHLGCRFYESTTDESVYWGSIQSANYMRSRDFGRTWERADGTRIKGTATAKTMDVLIAGESMDPKPGIRNDGAIVVDSEGSPYVLYFRNTPEKPGQIFLATADRETGKWRQLPLQKAMDRYYPGWAIVDSRAGFTITEDDRLYMAVSLAAIDHPKANWDGKPLSKRSNEPALWSHQFPEARRIAWVESKDRGQTFTAYSVLANDPWIAHVGPSLEMPTGHHRIAAGSYPGLIYYNSLASPMEVFYVDASNSEPLLPGPWGLQAKFDDGKVLLDWKDNRGSDGYNVYRSKASAGPFVKKNAALLKDSKFVDATVAENVKYLYAVRAVYDGAESENSMALPFVYRRPCVPLSLAGAPRVKGLRFWLDGSDVDADPKTPNPERGKPLSAWRDKICGLVLEQSVAKLQPVVSKVGAAPAVHFDNDSLVTSSTTDVAWFGDLRGSIVALYSSTNTGDAYGLEVGGGGDFLATQLAPQLGGGFSIQYYTSAGSNNVYYDKEPTADGKLHYSIINASSGVWTYFTDGVDPSGSRKVVGVNGGDWYGAVPNPTYVGLGQYLGGTGKPHGSAHTGHFVEILIYDHPLSEAERRLIGAYVAKKYR